MEKSQKNRIAIMGSTGSIGTQTLDVIAANPEILQVEVLTAGSNVKLLAQQARKFRPNAVVIQSEQNYKELKNELFDLGIKVFCGDDALCEIVEMESVDTVLTALVGFAGLNPTLRAINAGKNIALANKETLVVAGELVTKAARDKGVNIYPVDSEHSAIFQCLVGEFGNKIEKIVLTASGGPFRGMKRDELYAVSPAQALRHPNWDMGAKITIDSATLMNKGLEVIEAKWLFGLRPDQIEVIVHPQSIIHSIVQFEDGSMKAQMGLPDMKLPIQYALTFPFRPKSAFPRFDFAKYPSLSFEKPDTETFQNLKLAFDAMHTGGNAPCILNAANEVAVAEFLRGNLAFLDMPHLIQACLEKVPFIANPTLPDYMTTDKITRSTAEELVPAHTKTR